MKCANCGKNIPDTTDYCAYCGRRIQLPRGGRSGIRIMITVAVVVVCAVMLVGAVALWATQTYSPNAAPVPTDSEATEPISSRTEVPARMPVSSLEPSPTAPLPAVEYVRAGDELFVDSRYDEAIAQYQMAVSVEPQNAEAYARLGEAYLQLGNCDQAIPGFQQALDLDPDLESAQAGLMECGGALPPEMSFASYGRSDLNFSLLYPSTWSVREEELQTIFAENEEDMDSLTGNIFFVSSLPLAPDEEGMDSMGALIKARQLIALPMGSQLGGVEVVSLAGWEWATVQGEIAGLQTPSTIYITATVKDSNWYGIWAIGPTETWKQVSWPVVRTILSTVQLE